MLETIKWWFGWPWFKRKNRPKETFDVGISGAEAILHDGTHITITRQGKVLYAPNGWLWHSNTRLKETMNEKWVRADNNTYYNRHYILSYTVNEMSFLVYGDNTPLSAYNSDLKERDEEANV